MPVIKLITIIKAQLEICFDLSRSIDLHEISTDHTREKAVDGITSGLINLNETVTWQARHFGITQNLTSRITKFERPFHFRDEQVRGAFKYFIHDHFFSKENDHVIMKDVFDFQSPYSFAGKLVNRFILKSYMQKLLEKRNVVIKEYAESDLGKLLLEKN